MNDTEHFPQAILNRVFDEENNALRTSGGGGGDWGDIGGTLSDQTDLQTQLNAKANLSGGNTFEGAQVFNEAGADVDFRVEGDNDTHLIFVDASAGFVGINQSSHDGWAKFHVNGGTRFDDDFRFQKGSGTQYVARMGGSGYDLVFATNNGGTDLLTLTGDGAISLGNDSAFTGLVVNETGVDADFRIESDTDANAFFVDAGNNRIGIGTASPAERFHVYIASGSVISRIESGTGSDTGYRITNSNRSYLFYITGSNFTIRDSTGSSNRAIFSATETNLNDDGANVDFRVEGDTDANLFFLDASTDRIGIGTNAPNSKLDVVGTIQADALRLDVTPTAETPTMTHTVTVSMNGTDYKIPCVAA